MARGSPDPLPRIRQPMLATLVDKPFDDPDWLFETKWDGVRAIVIIRDRRSVRITSRTGHDLLVQFPELRALADAFKRLPIEVDGEIVSLDRKGLSSFQRLQGRLNRARPSPELVGELPATFVAFDCIYAEGKDRRREPLEQRKTLLKRLVRRGPAMFSTHVVREGRRAYTFAKKHGLEGIVGKLRTSTYQERRSRDWVKIKTLKQQEFVVGGWTEPRGSRMHFGALLLGLYEGKKLRYVGAVGTGFDRPLLDEVMGRLRKIPSPKPPFVNPPSEIVGAHWVRPRLVAEVKFGEWTRDNLLRQPVFMGLRTDKSPQACVLERPKPARVRS